MLRRISPYSAFLTLLAALCVQERAQGQSTFDGCGVLEQGFECMILVADASGDFYSLQNLGSFGAGASVHVVGELEPFCVSFCFLPCILNNTIAPCAGPPSFVRGDANGDSNFDIADSVNVLTQLFVPGTKASLCQDASDANDDGAVNIADAIYMLSALFASGAVPAPPYPNCGDDATADPLDCAEFSACP